jgi:hemolysin III
MSGVIVLCLKTGDLFNMSQNNPLEKPLLRGYFHQEAFFTALGACTLLIAKSSSRITLIASIVYSMGLLLLFAISAFYHRLHLQPKSRAVMKRLDHSAIFIVIAGTFTPICLLALSGKVGDRLLLIVWGTAFVGILQSVFWVKAPKWFSSLFYVTMGCLALPYLNDLRESLGERNQILIAAGGIAYFLGAIIYATKKPKLRPLVFGYHELFHVLTIIGAILHFVVIYQLIT